MNWESKGREMEKVEQESAYRDKLNREVYRDVEWEKERIQWVK